MEWTKTKPTFEGWYLWHHGGYRLRLFIPRLVRVFRVDGVMRMDIMEQGVIWYVSNKGGWWLGPLVSPVPLENATGATEKP